MMMPRSREEVFLVPLWGSEDVVLVSLRHRSSLAKLRLCLAEAQISPSSARAPARR